MWVRSTGDRAEQSAPQTAHYFVCAARGHFWILYFIFIYLFISVPFYAGAQKANF